MKKEDKDYFRSWGEEDGVSREPTGSMGCDVRDKKSRQRSDVDSDTFYSSHPLFTCGEPE